MQKYSLSLIFYPQDDGQYHVVCPEINNCFSCGRTREDAEINIRELIRDLLPARVGKNDIDEEMFRLGLCMKEKEFCEIEVAIDAGKIVFPAESESTCVYPQGLKAV